MLVSSLPNNAVHTTRPSNLVIPSSSALSSTSPTTPPLTAHPPTSHASIPRATPQDCFGRETRSEHPGRRRPSLQRRIRSLHTTRRFLRHRGEQGCHYERKLRPPRLREFVNGRVVLGGRKGNAAMTKRGSNTEIPGALIVSRRETTLSPRRSL
ncbi:hypothetical protein BC834DRAFT_310670 [Gloeopeniophorella convolvens]|nr:hypothetical protein BC834DRAFT_310670 [Gloeopeniophorella convolvens]